MEVTFGLMVGERGMMTEEELDRDLPGRRADLAGYLDLRGQVRWRHGETEVVFHDHVDYLATNLCIKAVPELRAGRPVEFIFYSQPGGVRLLPEGDSVRVFLDDEEAGRFPAQELPAALLGCASRIATTLERLAGDDVNVRGAALALRNAVGSVE